MKMKTISRKTFGLLLSLLFLVPGCATTGGGSNSAQIAATLRFAAQTGTTFYLASHPEARPYFQGVGAVLLSLSTGQLDPATVLKAVDALGGSPEASLVVTGALTLYSIWYGNSTPISGDAQVAIKALAEGFVAGSVEAGPVALASRSLKTPTPVKVSPAFDQAYADYMKRYSK